MRNIRGLHRTYYVEYSTCVYLQWEQKPMRMLMFKLTDGTQTVQGMEYKPVRCLSPQTQPGAKVGQ